MISIKTSHCNFQLGPPTGMTEDQVATLHCQRHSTGFTSYWQPTEAERRIISDGGMIAFTCHSSSHPAVNLLAIPHKEDVSRCTDGEEAYLHRAIGHLCHQEGDPPFSMEDLARLVMDSHRVRKLEIMYHGAQKLLLGLIRLTGPEGANGSFRVTLDYDNVHDGARILDADGKVITECYTLPEGWEMMQPDEVADMQFITAIQSAVTKRDDEPLTTRPLE